MTQRGIQLTGCIVLSLLLIGCAGTTRQGMYWGNYEQTLYNVQDEQDQRSRERHLASLRDIVAVSERRGWRVPPGVYIELAVMEQAIGNSQLYAYYVNRERALYPESRPFIQRWFGDVLPAVEVPPPIDPEEAL
ncbi:DUF4810 domain-containing protein [Aliidiomarina sp. Khilg15.8]